MEHFENLEGRLVFSGGIVTSYLSHLGLTASATVMSNSAKATAMVATPSPVISSIGGINSVGSGVINGRAAESEGTKWNGCLVIDSSASTFPWTVTGNNFGTSPAPVYINYNGSCIPLK